MNKVNCNWFKVILLKLIHLRTFYVLLKMSEIIMSLTDDIHCDFSKGLCQFDSYGNFEYFAFSAVPMADFTHGKFLIRYFLSWLITTQSLRVPGVSSAVSSALFLPQVNRYH